MKIDRIPFGCAPLDELLGGGVEVGAITQFFGEAGSGKTNACLLLARNVVLSGKKVIYIDTEGVSLERLTQVCGDDDFKAVFKKILFFEPHDFAQQEEAIKKTKTLCASDVHPGLVIIDSMTLFYRVLQSLDTHGESRHMLGSQMNVLLGIAREYDMPVVITTQVYMDPEANMLQPVGGYLLAHQSKAIIRLDKLEHGLRRARVMKHRSIPSGKDALFKISEAGFSECSLG